MTNPAPYNVGRLEIDIEPGKIRTILISAREVCLSPWNDPATSSTGLRISVGETF